MTGSIRVVSKRPGGLLAEEGEIIIAGDRSGLFGNPYPLRDWRDSAERARVIARHRREILEPDILTQGPLYQEMERLAGRVRAGEALALSCWCAPSPCHCDPIAAGVRRLVVGENLVAITAAEKTAREQDEAARRATFTFFFSYRHPWSNWHPAGFTLGHQHFCCNEQCLMWHKAMHFGDTEIAQRILQTSDPAEHKRLGRQVKNFDREAWMEVAEDIVLIGARAKMAAHPQIAAQLIASAGTTLVEASPYDKIWGAGLAESDPDIVYPERWPGENRLGGVFEVLRDELVTAMARRPSLRP